MKGEIMKIIRTADPQMKKIMEIADSISHTKATVLIYGESGTGKELIARYIHTRSSRSGKDFVAVNCAALPDGLLESELFGYERGAFTGADSRKLGKLELAHQSSFLLDEISELPLLLQSKLLRFIQEGEVERLGGLKPQKVDVRLIAATNKNLSDLIKSGEFREDLFYRLNVVPISIPPLRFRKNDIELLSQYFLENVCTENGLTEKKLEDSALKKLLQWKWPGNVRELENVIERSALLSSKRSLKHEDILIEGTNSQEEESDISVGITVSEAEKRLILKTLEFTSNNRTQAAHILGISIRTLRNKLNEYRLGEPYGKAI